MTKKQIVLLALTIMFSLCAIIGLIIYLVRVRVITPEMALLMFVALLGFYVGFGVLILVYRLVRRLE